MASNGGREPLSEREPVWATDAAESGEGHVLASRSESGSSGGTGARDSRANVAGAFSVLERHARAQEREATRETVLTMLRILRDENERLHRIIAWYWKAAGPYPRSVDFREED